MKALLEKIDKRQAKISVARSVFVIVCVFLFAFTFGYPFHWQILPIVFPLMIVLDYKIDKWWDWNDK